MREAALLLLLHREPAHGYTLLEQLKEFGLREISSSVIYRALRDMEARGWVASMWDEEQTQGPPRRVYCITNLGGQVLALWVQDLEESRKRIDYLLRAYDRHVEKRKNGHH